MDQDGEEVGSSVDTEAPRPQTLLDLGASPDYKDSRGLTPLYHSALGGGDALCCELLLHDHAQLGTTDENGWQEIHQVGREPCQGGEVLGSVGRRGIFGSLCRSWDSSPHASVGVPGSVRGPAAPPLPLGLPLWACAAPGAPAVLRS